MKKPIPRIWIFIILFSVIVIAHIIILRVMVHGEHGENAPQEVVRPNVQPPAATTATAPAKSAPAKPAGAAAAKPEPGRKAEAQTVKDEKPGFFERLFGGGRSAKTEPTKPAEPPKPVEPPKPAFRYRKPSANPFFGAPLDFSRARHGNLPAKAVPGANGVGTGIIVDMDTRKVLWEKNSQKPVPVASMVKMMTMLLTAEAMERTGKPKLDDKITITRTVMQVKRTGVLWLAPGESFTLRELLLGIAVKSANDAATQVAEVIGGDVDTFVRSMNERAKELNLNSIHFYNPCGLPDKRGRDAVGSAADMVLLGEHLLEYPFLIEMCSTLKGAIRDGKTVFVNTNHLIAPHYPGVDGLKTGFINKSGFCLTFSALRDGRRIIGCVTGFKNARDRDRFCRRLIDWAYQQPGK